MTQYPSSTKSAKRNIKPINQTKNRNDLFELREQNETKRNLKKYHLKVLDMTVYTAGEKTITIYIKLK